MLARVRARTVMRACILSVTVRMCRHWQCIDERQHDVRNVPAPFGTNAELPDVGVAKGMEHGHVLGELENGKVVNLHALHAYACRHSCT